MALIVDRHDVEGLLDPLRAMEVLEPVMLEEINGTASHLQPSGGASSLRVVGGILKGMRRMGVRIRGQTSLYDAESGELLGIVSYRGGVLRVGATMALAARYLARPDSRRIGLLGSGSNALNILQCLTVVRPIERVEVYSPTPEHRIAFAARAASALGIPVTPRATADEVTQDADIIAVATNARSPVLTFSQLRPGVHVTSMGVHTELDASVFLGVSQFVTPSRSQEIAGAKRGNAGGPGALAGLIEEGKMKPDSIVELGSIINGDVTPCNGPADITLFRESQGGVGDIALANYVYEYARDHGLGVEVDL